MLQCWLPSAGSPGLSHATLCMPSSAVPTPCVLSGCRHYPSKDGHGLSDTWYDNPVPTYPPTSWVVPREQGKSFQTGECWLPGVDWSTQVPAAAQGAQGVPAGAPHSITASWLCAGSPDTKAEGLEGQINRLAKLIGKLEDKVRASISLCGAVLPSQGQSRDLAPAVLGQG